MTDRKYIIGANAYEAPALEPALYLVATPIGNLGDITLRAIETIAAADVLACEDTRVTRILLDRYGIHQKPIVYQEHNVEEAGKKLLGALEDNQSVALVSDAGMPLISDPGFRLVAEAREKNIKIVPVPGASAALTALIATGLPTDSFFFSGFLPTKSMQRKARLEELASIPASLIFYESPHRVSTTLADMVDVFGKDRRGAICREMTKKFETVDVAPLSELHERYNDSEKIRGEIVIIVEPPSKQQEKFDTEEIDKLLVELAKDFSAAKAAAEAAKMTGHKKTELYKRLLSLKAG
ncbi:MULTISPECIES: 16S rRNA (cytidine(1402)-2'-O)-methyltransferase [Bartonella]|uniref:16S rRNA (cytidine(1402)-2'-O)-methyltransferase n=1 Tax=Bartonella TaxID=773 RepID=UPI0018DB9243|nr:MULTISPECIES: 16S rRNA (cytidine(1402)-2'-O)-methyltransferase [Bartonella]MBH9975982.1 16S rRNA (cytidine(1402)-2'-O)-methyltransferase [Bartonella choladocola]MBI0015677.1 16S rRNA (cytidine(1402)-2'-O)-methyltransferase [Bartonella sp. B10834G3]